MPGLATNPSRLAWLTSCLADRRIRLNGLLRRIAGLGVPAALKPSLFRKFLDMLDEVAANRDEEAGLLSRIEAVEQKHRFMRKHKKLRRTGPRAKTAAAFREDENRDEKAKKAFRDFLWYFVLWLILLWNLFPPRKINQKKQGLTAN